MAQAPIPASPPESDPSMDDILASIRRILSDEEKSSKPQANNDDVLKLEPSMMIENTTMPSQTAQQLPSQTAQQLPSQGAQQLPPLTAQQSPPQAAEQLPPQAAPQLPSPQSQQQSHYPSQATAPPAILEPSETAPMPQPQDEPAYAPPQNDRDDNPRPSWAQNPTPRANWDTGADPSSLVAAEPAALAAASVGALMRTLVSERNAAVHRGGPSIEDLVREEIRPLLKGWLDAHLPGLVERLVRAEIERVVGRSSG